MDDKAERDWKTIVDRIAAGRTWRHDTYARVLTRAHRLQGRTEADGLSSSVARRAERLVDEIRDDYSDHETVRDAVERISGACEQKRRVAYTELHQSFPSSQAMLEPTRLGNVMAALQTDTLDRYGIDLDALWPRLEQVTSADARARIDDRNIYLDFTLMMSMLAFVAAVVSAVVAVLDGSRPLLARLVVVAAALAAFVLFYRLAVLAGRVFVAQMEAVVDLHRLKLIDALELQRPPSPEAEKALWTELRHFIALGRLPKVSFSASYLGIEEPKPEEVV